MAAPAPLTQDTFFLLLLAFREGAGEVRAPRTKLHDLHVYGSPVKCASCALPIADMGGKTL